MTATDTRAAKDVSASTARALSGPGSLGSQDSLGTQAVDAARGTSSPQANPPSAPIAGAPAGDADTRTAKVHPATNSSALSGPDVLNGQPQPGAQVDRAVEGQASPQAMSGAVPMSAAPAGSTAAPPARHETAPIRAPLEGRGASQDQRTRVTQRPCVLAADLPGRHMSNGTRGMIAAGEQDPPAANHTSAPMSVTLLADPLLALAADVLSDLEKVRVANENRLRQLTRSAGDSDGEMRGFGLDEAHSDVARLAALVGMLAGAEHKATLNLQRVMRKHPLGPWLAAQKGIGEKQGARLLAAIGDSQAAIDTHACVAGGELNGSGPGQRSPDAHTSRAGVAPKRQRGQHANWSAAAKMRAFLVAESCMKQSGTSQRAVYDATKAKYAEAVHAAECARCGPKGKPAQPGSPLSDGHKHARALRAVAKEILRDLWREAKRIHEEIA